MSMIPEEEENNAPQPVEEENDAEKVDYSHITKHTYLNKVFCWIGKNLIM